MLVREGSELLGGAQGVLLGLRVAGLHGQGCDRRYGLGGVNAEVGQLADGRDCKALHFVRGGAQEFDQFRKGRGVAGAAQLKGALNGGVVRGGLHVAFHGDGAH